MKLDNIPKVTHSEKIAAIQKRAVKHSVHPDSAKSIKFLEFKSGSKIRFLPETKLQRYQRKQFYRRFCIKQ